MTAVLDPTPKMPTLVELLRLGSAIPLINVLLFADTSRIEPARQTTSIHARQHKCRKWQEWHRLDTRHTERHPPPAVSSTTMKARQGVPLCSPKGKRIEHWYYRRRKPRDQEARRSRDRTCTKGRNRKSETGCLQLAFEWHIINAQSTVSTASTGSNPHPLQRGG